MNIRGIAGCPVRKRSLDLVIIQVPENATGREVSVDVRQDRDITPILTTVRRLLGRARIGSREGMRW
ncbi:MAG: hypothetical protein ACE5QF_01395 [Thermoplasmata archaeon]